jgi:hypothetical protein
MTAYRPGIDPDRRKKPDFWVRSMGWIAVLGWLIMLIALFIVSEAKPQTQNFFDKLTTREPSSSWNLELAQYIFYLMIAGFFMGISGFIINVKRHRRKSDEYRLSFILVTIISMLGILFYIFLT